MVAGVSGPLPVPLALVLHRVGESVVAYLERLGLRAAVGDGVIEGERLRGGIIERAVVVDRGNLLVAEALHVVDAPVDTLVRRERVSDSGEEFKFSGSLGSIPVGVAVKVTQKPIVNFKGVVCSLLIRQTWPVILTRVFCITKVVPL